MSFLERRNQDVRRRRRLLTRPRAAGRSDTCRPQDSHSARRLPREPIYLSFVTKAVLWDRGVPHRTAGERPRHSPQPRPRFLSLVKASPDDLTPPRVLTSGPQPPPPPHLRGETSSGGRTPAKAQTPEGSCHLVPARRTGPVQTEALLGDKNRAAAAAPPPAPPLDPPPPPVPATPPSSTNIPTPLSWISGGQPSRPDSLPPSPAEVQPAAWEKHAAYYHHHQQQQQQQPPAALSVTETTPALTPLSAGWSSPPSPTSAASCVSLSDLSRPSSSLFSRSTSLSSGRRSFLSAVCRDWNPDDDPAACSPPLRPSPSPSPSPLPDHLPVASPALPKPTCGPPRTRPPRRASAVQLLSRGQSAHGLRPDSASCVAAEPSSGGHPALPASLTFPSTTWSSCPSPQSSTAPNLSPGGPAARLESLRWPVLPSISPVRGRCSSAASGSSEVSCSPSQVFDQLEAIAPRSTSCPSVDDASDWSGGRSPDTDLSPGLAALTVGCDSGNLGALSRVQLLLLDRVEAGTPPSPLSLEEELPAGQDWSQLRLQHLDPAGGLQPLASDWSDSPGEVLDHRSDSSDGRSGSPSSWIIDREDASSPCSDRGDSGLSLAGRRGRSESPASGERRSGEEEQRRTKALDLLCMLQEDTPLRPDATAGFCNFEDFDFLAKYCIFSREKLAEYKRAFQAADADGDGYISCLQVLLTLKTIIPPKLLSEEEEIYVYRILEMVDFRVTDGLVDLRLFAVIASLAQKVACMDDFMRSLIGNMDFRSLEVRLFKAKQLFLFLLEEQQGEPGLQQGFISAEQLLLELKAGGIRLEQEAAVRLELQRVPPLDLLDFLAHLPLFMLIHKSVISNPLDDSSRRL
ncbi:uncharacterized protein LOC142890713 isoform X2 [Nelusetta ayraudi]|uniref:uncharacterized protein LOC142890713 isoform X2 n=1 Tax=Nelusetta ayraudi TaxID=303726 RepID=UPI003F727C93